jgi:pyrophosphatase PpaX
MRKYNFILFDWDGNLAQTLDIWLECLKIPLEKRGYHLTDEEIGADYTAFKLRMKDQDDAEVVDAIIAEAKELALHREPNVELYPDALEVLEYLHDERRKLALVTMSEHAKIDLLLKKFNLTDLFDAVVCGDDVSNQKPQAEPLEKALDLLRGNLQQAIMVGDSSNDIKAAHNAGIDSALFYPAKHTTFYNLDTLKELQPTMVIEDFKELMRLP